MAQSIPNQEDYNRQVVSWACSTLRKAGWHFESTEDKKGWYVQTPTGWEDANSAADLAKIAKRAQGNPV